MLLSGIDELEPVAVEVGEGQAARPAIRPLEREPASDERLASPLEVVRVEHEPGRRVLMEPFRDRLFFAGEAVHETLWGTVGGAWESGDRAADGLIRRIGR